MSETSGKIKIVLKKMSPTEQRARDLVAKISAEMLKLGIMNKNVLLVEGGNDKALYEKFLSNGVAYYFPGNKINILIGGVGSVLVKKGIVHLVYRCFVVEQLVSKYLGLNLKNRYLHNNSFYGIIDTDYNFGKDEKDEPYIESIASTVPDFLKDPVLDFLKDSAPTFLKAKRVISVYDANDVETLLFRNAKGAVKSVYLKNLPEFYSKTINEDSFKVVWKWCLKTAIRKAYKIGYLRFQSYEIFKTEGKYIDFKKIFTYDCPQDYYEYAIEKENCETKKLGCLLMEHLNWRREIAEEYWMKLLPTPFTITDKWKYLRGHDLTGVLACLIFSLISTNKTIKDIENELIETIIANVDISKFSKTKVYKFIRRNRL